MAKEKRVPNATVPKAAFLSARTSCHGLCKVRISLRKSAISCVAMIASFGSIGVIVPAQSFLVTPPNVAGFTPPPNVIKNANVINLYMAADWNQVAPSGLGETKEAIDSWTQALLASSYFTFAGQYTIGTPHFVGGFNSSGLCVPSISGVVSTWNVGNFVNCNLTVGALGDLVSNAHLQDILVNVFLDPG